MSAVSSLPFESWHRLKTYWPEYSFRRQQEIGQTVDAGSVIVILGVIVLILGLSLMRKGSRGAEEQPPEYDEGEANPDASGS